MVGKGDVRAWKQPGDGCTLALVGATGPHFGGSVLDAITGCGGKAPEQADPAILATIRNKVRLGAFRGITDLSQGGLLDALAVLAPHATVKLSGDPYEQLFAETYGRFLVAVDHENSLKGLSSTVIGKTGGSSLTILTGGQSIEITDNDRETALSSLSTIMRGTKK
jgi:phosphoribosylformylglycinamidine synthase